MNNIPVYIDAFLAPVRDEQAAQVALIAVLLLTVLDVIFGLVNALVSKSFSSSKMRAGIAHKSASMGFLLVGIVVDGTIIGGLDLGFSAPVLTTICIYLCLMEVASLLETFALLNPELSGSPLFRLLEASGAISDEKQMTEVKENSHA